MKFKFLSGYARKYLCYLIVTVASMILLADVQLLIPWIVVKDQV